MLSQKAVEEYRKIMKRERGVEYTKEEARKAAESLLNLFKIIYRPIPKK